MKNKIIRITISKSLIINMEVYFPFGTKTLFEEFMKAVGS
jgi:hypothetical protein